MTVSLKYAAALISWKPAQLSYLIRAEKPKWAKKEKNRYLIDLKNFKRWKSEYFE